MQDFIVQIVGNYGYVGVCLLIALENFFPPIPSEIILTFSGYMTTLTELNVWGVIGAATVGALIGAFFLYGVGRVLSVERLEKLIAGRLGRILRLKVEDVRMAEKWFAKYGPATVFFCRFVPIVRSLISIPAGVAKMKMSVFLPLTITGTFIWNLVLVFLGRMAGTAWGRIAHYFDLYSTIALVCILLSMAAAGAYYIKKRFITG